MKKKEEAYTDQGLVAILQELKENPYRKFNIAFSLMGIIPFLVFFYILINRVSSLDILAGNIGIILAISIFVSLCGFLLGYKILKDVLNRIIFYAAQAKHSDQLKSTFVSTVSHELKNPLTIIKTGLSDIKLGLVGQVSVEQNRILDICHDVIERMNRLITDLLDLHKIEAGMTDVRRRLCNIAEILEKQIREFKIMIEKKKITFIKEILHNELPVWADEERIAQVVNNLLSNAVKYTPEKGVISLRTFPYDEFVRIELVDSGPGIPEDKLEKIFNKFERLDITKEGTGLGLSISKDIVEMHKGRIWVESQPGKGSRFVVILPKDLRKKDR